jgi:chromosome partitioning protein
MTKTVAIANRKGGVGKTATAHALGAGLQRKGYRVLFIDLDSQCNLTDALGIDSGSVEASSLDVLEGSSEALETIISTDRGDILPATPALATADKVIEGVGAEYRLREALQPIARRYDYIIIDTPPALGVLTVNALTASNSLIIPAQADLYSLQGIEQLTGTIEAVKRFTNRKLSIAGILLTRYVARSIISQDMKSNLEELARALGTKVFRTPIRECTAVKEAQATHSDIYSYSSKSNASKDYKDFVEEFLGG